VASTPLLVAYSGTGLVSLNGRPAASGAIWLAAGDVLEVAGTGFGYLATLGGWDAPPVLGSAATDTLSGLGPDLVKPGDLLASCGGREPLWGRHSTITDLHGAVPVAAGIDGHTAVGVFEMFVAQRWTLTGVSRSGIRLAGDPLPVLGGSIDPTPMVDGVIQLPPSGQPIVLGPDHGTVGGYPVLGVLPRESLDAMYRLSEGAHVRFVEGWATKPTARFLDLTAA
jgi:allophanate hydrolase subunit 2